MRERLTVVVGTAPLDTVLFEPPVELVALEQQHAFDLVVRDRRTLDAAVERAAGPPKIFSCILGAKPTAVRRSQIVLHLSQNDLGDTARQCVD
jgi:hypothetical protein